MRPNFTQELVKLRAGQYQLDKQHSFLIFKIEHLGLSKIVGRFNELDATLDFNPEELTELKLSGIVTANSIDLNNKDLEDTLQEESWFDSARFPQIVFNSSTIEPVADNNFNINGTISIRGIEKDIVLSANFNGGADNLFTRKYTIGFSANTKISRAEFGMDTFLSLIHISEPTRPY